MSVTIPPEEPYGDIELDLIDNEPAGLFPSGQDSLWGQYRKLLGDYLQINVADPLAQWYDNLDPRTVNEGDLPEWEAKFGIPYSPTLTLEQRRGVLLSRLYRGGFTRTSREKIIENFIVSTFGPALSFDPSGLSLEPGGLAMFSGVGGDVKTMYRVYEDVRNFSYRVHLLDVVDPDITALNRELTRLTPAGISYSLVELANILDYGRCIIDKQPVGYWRSPNIPSDYSGYGNSVNVGSATEVVGLINAAVAGSGAGNPHNAFGFNGTNQYLGAPWSSLYSGMSQMSAEAWFRCDAKPATDYGMVIAGGSWQMRVNTDQTLGFWVLDGPSNDWYGYTIPISLGQVYHAVGVKTATDIEIYLNGVRRFDLALDPAPFPEVVPPSASALNVGGLGVANTYFTGVIDEPAVYNYALSAEDVLDNFLTGTNLTGLPNSLTLSGGVITDAIRALGVSGDGR
jgi:hypothetical protein